MSPRRLLRIAWWKRPENLRLAAALVTGACGIALGVWALTLAQSAQGENRRDIDATQLNDLRTCQTGNRTRPQIAINTLVANDGTLQSVGISERYRRVAAAGAVRALDKELDEGKSIGFRDCTGDGQVNRADFLPGQPPPRRAADGRPELLGANGLPTIEENP